MFKENPIDKQNFNPSVNVIDCVKCLYLQTFLYKDNTEGWWHSKSVAELEFVPGAA